MDLKRRIVVALPPVGEAAWSGIGPIGVLRFRSERQTKLAVAVRVVSPWVEAGEPLLPGLPFPATTEIAFHRAFMPLSARELTPAKRSCDVGFKGMVGGREGRSGPAPLSIQIGDEKRRYTLSTAEGGDLAALSAELSSGGTGKLGHGDVRPFADDASYDEETEIDAIHSIAPVLRFPHPVVKSPIKVTSDWASLDATLGFDVFIRVDYLDDTISLPAVRCDAVTFDFDERRVEWLFRGIALDPAEGREIERVVVSAFAAGQDEFKARVDAWLPHSAFVHAATPAEVEGGVHPESLADDELAMARYSTWDVGPAAATIPIEEVAQIQVELQQGRNRAAVLDGHGLDEYRWNVEERAASEGLAESGAAMLDSSELDPEAPPSAEADETRDLATRYRKAYEEALGATPYAGKVLELDRYAEIRAAMELRNPVRVLERAKLAVGDFVSIEMSMQSRFEASEPERLAFEKSYAAALARMEAEGPHDDDFDAGSEDDDDDADKGGA